MLTSIIHDDDERRDVLAAGVRQDLRAVPTEELLWQRDLMGFVVLDDHDQGDDSAVLASALHQAISDELARRQRVVERYKGNPLAPRWPDGGSERYQSLLERARDVKLLIPIDRFFVETLGVALEPAGTGRLKGTCLFHTDRSPSLLVYLDRQDFHCFGCAAHGDVITAATSAFGLSGFREAVERLEELALGAIGGTS